MALAALVGAFAPEAAAQARGKIAGTVTDAATGEPLPGVNVLVVGTSLGAATDPDGDYFIANLPLDTYAIKATFIGYRDVTVTDVEVQAGATTTIDIEMEEATMGMEGEIVVTADRPLVERDNTTSSVRLESRELETRPTTEFTDVLTTLPGVDVVNGQVRVRGGTLDEVAFVVDGARARNPLNHNPYTRLNLSSIQEVEVITGSFNAEYGEAQSGVVNVITKEGRDEYELYVDSRYEPPGKRHFGTAFYDQSSSDYWENANARHVEWWIENTDQWVDPNGIAGSDPRSVWTPEEAYQNYMDTHQPLTDYTDIPTYQVEVGGGGRVPLLNNLYFFGSMKYRSEAPVFGNAFRDEGNFTDGTFKLTYRMPNGMKLTGSAFYGREEAGWGFGGTDYFWALNYGVDGRYAYNDFEGYPYSQTNGQTLQFANVLNASTLYEIKLARVQALRSVGVFPGDSLGFEASDATRDNIRAVDANGNPIPGGYANRIGYHTTGYFFRYDDNNTEWNAEGYISSQLNKFWQVKAGADFSYYVLDHYNESKFPTRTDDRTYRPYQGALYGQNKFEFGGLIVNAGLRFDFYNANDTLYTDLFQPLNEEAEKEETSLYAQLSPRLGVSHPIDENTVLHFSYGHFFQRPAFNDYGEGNDEVLGSLNTFLIEETGLPWVLANRDLRPRKTVAYEVGIERNFWDFFVIDVTGYYKDIRNTIRTITIETPEGVYKTNGNGDYADVRGLELSLRKVPSDYRWGTIAGYFNASLQQGIFGRSGAPVVITPNGVRYAPSGDFIEHRNPYLKAGLFYQTPAWEGLLGALAGGWGISVDHLAVLPNEELRSDFFLFDGQKYLRSVDQSTDLRARKTFTANVSGRTASISPYVEVHNLFNDRWVFLGAFERASQADQRAFVESDFEDLPEVDAGGVPILDVAKFRNLPRSVLFGVTLEY
jgi:outer membrane receptor protein involved in Fe transport